MTLYAVHYAWVDDHATKAPVGIWGEGGICFYPPETDDYRSKGSQAETEASQMLWADWVENRTEWGSTYGASWSAVESDEPMEEILTGLRTEFFSEPHPVTMISLPELPEDSGAPEEDSVEDEEDSEESGPSDPAQRFVIAQSWWIAAELARRHPELLVHEMHPGGGQYDVLAVLSPPYVAARMQVMLNRVGTIQVHQNDGRNGEPDMELISTWSDALSASSPHAVVKHIEDVANLGSPAKAPSSTPRALAYRFIAVLLSMTVNDRHSWDARNEFIDSSGDWWPGSPEVHGFLEGFPDVRRDLPSTPKLGLWHEPESHFWAVLRNKVPVAIVSTEGRVYRADRRYDLAAEYSSNERRMLPLITKILSDLLP